MLKMVNRSKIMENQNKNPIFYLYKIQALQGKNINHNNRNRNK